MKKRGEQTRAKVSEKKCEGGTNRREREKEREREREREREKEHGKDSESNSVRKKEQ